MFLQSVAVVSAFQLLGRMEFHKREIANWGNYPRIVAEVATPEFLADLKAVVEQVPSVIARGNGRCYGDASLNDHVVSMTKFNKFLCLDKKRGTLSCQAGVTLSEILNLIVPAGFFLPVTPGTKFVTVGGAIAADVHGKNHHVDGCFSQNINWLNLLVGDGEIVRCSPTKNENLFWNSVGGMGRTGIITESEIQLRPIETAYIRQESCKAESLDEVMNLFEESNDWTYTVAWIDCLQKGKRRGRSILMRGEHALESELTSRQKTNPLVPLAKTKKRKSTVPFYFPGFTLNRFSVKAFNALYYAKQFSKVSQKVIDYDSFFYPLDSILYWNRIYGRNGFTQYQLALPLESSREGLLKILDVIHQSGQGSFLAVLKRFGAKNSLAANSFPMEGYTLALDFKIYQGIQSLVRKLDDLVVRYGGRVYLAKDAFSSPEVFSYLPDLKHDKFASHQSKRLFKT